jgi:hypothetical protein
MPAVVQDSMAPAPILAAPSMSPVPVAAAYPFPPQNDDKAVISLILGVLALVSFSILTGIPAIVLGNASRQRIRASAGQLTGEGMATAGVVMGWISVGLIAVVGLMIVAMLLFLIPGSR